MTLAEKIARLVAERGWNQLEFARRTGLNRNTARQLLTNPDKRLRNDTIRRCADALGVTVHELRDRPLSALMQRTADGTAGRRAASGLLTQEQLALAFAAQPELRGWLERNPERGRKLGAAEVDELLSLHATGGPLTVDGIEHFIGQIERRRVLLERITALAGTEYLDLLEQLVNLMWEKVQP